MTAEDNALYYGDCLTWMEEWLPDARHSVDLIYLDPPFNSNTNYNILFGRGNGVSAQMRGFTDTWRWDAAAAERQARLEDATRHPVHEVARALRALLGESGMLAYLTYLGERLAVMRDLLKPNGALYLHCDDTASHYLRILLDAIFGPQRYRNHIAWRRATAHNDSRRFGRILDHILYYANGDDPYWDGDAIAEPRTEEEIARAYPLTDDRGRYRAAAHLTAAGVTKEGESGRPWKGYDISAAGRHWSPPRTGTYAEYIERELILGYRSIKGVHARLDALDAAGLIVEPGNGNGNDNGTGLPALKRYAAADRGVPPQNLILNPIGFTDWSAGRGERLGYPTQKPLALLEKLITVSCPPGGLVLDPFCGCGTAVVAAHNLGRRWMGIDISATAIELILGRRLEPMGITLQAQGMPHSLADARKQASEQPYSFESWAITRIPGFAPNDRQRGDGGVDGRAMLLNQPENHESRLALAQVKGGAFHLSAFRDFLHVIEREDAAAGVFITLDPVSSPSARAEAREQGEIAVGAERYPRVQLWSIADFFEGRKPSLPTLADPYRGGAVQPALRPA